MTAPWTPFAVELDDSSHLSPEAIIRDRKKDAICDADSFDLLRVESAAFTAGPRKRQIVDYLIDAHQLGIAFDEAQNAGQIPLDESYDYRSIFDMTPDGHWDFMNYLGADAQRLVAAQWMASRLPSPLIQGLWVDWADGWSEGWSWVSVDRDLWLFQSVRLRTYKFACGLLPGELARDLSTAALGDDLAQLAAGAPVLRHGRDLQAMVERAKNTDLGTNSLHLLDHTNFWKPTTNPER